jgi:hypothetical protein
MDLTSWYLAPNSLVTNNNVIIPDRVGVTAIAFPSKVRLQSIVSKTQYPKINFGKLTPVIFGLIVLLVHCAPLGFEAPLPTVNPAIVALFSHVWMLPSVPRWYSKHVHAFVGNALDDAIPFGDRSGRVASSVSRLYMRILDCPPMRRCLFVPWAESGIVMKLTCESVRALLAFLGQELASGFGEKESGECMYM